MGFSPQQNHAADEVVEDVLRAETEAKGERTAHEGKRGQRDMGGEQRQHHQPDLHADAGQAQPQQRRILIAGVARQQPSSRIRTDPAGEPQPQHQDQQHLCQLAHSDAAFAGLCSLTRRCWIALIWASGKTSSGVA